MRHSLILFLFACLSSLAVDPHLSSPTTPKNPAGGHAVTSDLTPQQKAKEEYEKARKDQGGCLWRDEDWKKSETDADYKALMDRICQAEAIAIEKTNQDRKKYCKNPLILDQRLSYVSRLNAIRLIREGGVRNSNPHSAWYQGLPQKWFKDFFPAASSVMKFERENMWGMGGGPQLQSMASDRLASQAVSSWIHSSGHHAPMIDCNNRYVGVGFSYDPKRSEWLGFMSFAE